MALHAMNKPAFGLGIPFSALITPGGLLSLARRPLRLDGLWLVALSTAVGAVAGLLTVLLSLAAEILQEKIYAIPHGRRLDELERIPIASLIWLPVGGLLLGFVAWRSQRAPARPLMDVVEANALHGGALPARDSIMVCVQTLLSNGFGASVGLEAAFAQAGGAAASFAGRKLKLRRQDLRTLLGAGAGAAIGAAFGAPLTGAFYAFEIVIGSYAPTIIAPVAAACLAGALTAAGMGLSPYSLHVAAAPPPTAWDYATFAGLGLICAVAGIAIMRLMADAERLVRRTGLPTWIRPCCGGLILAVLGFLEPQTLSSGHGALSIDLTARLTLGATAAIFLLKACASIMSLGFGFRGGLFFASLMLGSLLGQMYIDILSLTGAPVSALRDSAALVAMGSLAAAIVGGPLTMAFLVLESTRDFGVTAATLVAAMIGSTLVRERFGYSLSTWRLHLRGETVRSARDIGWIRSLTAGRMMQTAIDTIPNSATVAEFRERFPLGAALCVAVIDDSQRYMGLVFTADAWMDSHSQDRLVRDLARADGAALSPRSDIEHVMRMFDQTAADALVVADDRGSPIGLVSQADVARRYVRELEVVHHSIFGETP